jgi:hypothetical protein
MQNFPSMIKHKGVIRLKVAAVCTALDTQIFQCVEDEEEIAPFLSPIGKKYFHQSTREEFESSAPVDPHAFLYIVPTGTLADLVDIVLSALIQSVDRGELQTVERKIDLVSSEINAEETWISTSDFMDWCATRDLEFGEVSRNYQDSEEVIMSRIDDLVYDNRREFEAPFFDAQYAERMKLPFVSEEQRERDYDSLLRENMLLKMGFDPSMADDQDLRPSNVSVMERPLRATERNALLSIIAVLCDEAGYDTDRAAKTAGVIKSRADLAGIDLGETTIENHLKKIPDAITRRLRK